jgi:hypothetical protein
MFGVDALQQALLRCGHIHRRRRGGDKRWGCTALHKVGLMCYGSASKCSRSRIVVQRQRRRRRKRQEVSPGRNALGDNREGGELGSVGQSSGDSLEIDELL